MLRSDVGAAWRTSRDRRLAVAGTASTRGRRVSLLLLAVFVVGFGLLAASRLLPPQPYGVADDYRVFHAAATVVGAGGDPYDRSTIEAAEQRADPYPTVQPSLDVFVNPPAVALLMQPLGRLPFWWSYAIFSLLSLGVACLALRSLLRLCGIAWGAPAVVGPSAVVGLTLCSWVSLLGFASGQFDALLLGAVVLSLVLVGRGRDALAGVLTAAAVVKPNLLWPLPLLLAAALVPEGARLRRFGAGAAAGIGGLVALQLVLLRGVSGSFVREAVAFQSSVDSVQPDLAGLPGLTGLVGGRPVAMALGVVGIVAVLGFACWWGSTPRARRLSTSDRALLAVAMGLGAWLSLAPYSHPNDCLLLLPLLGLAVGRDAEAITADGVVAGAIVCLAVVAVSLIPGSAGVGLGVTLIGSWLLVGRRRARLPTRELSAGVALVSLVVLPTIWPFHVLRVSLTPLAVVAVCVAGAVALRHRMADSGERPDAATVRQRSSAGAVASV